MADISLTVTGINSGAYNSNGGYYLVQENTKIKFTVNYNTTYLPEVNISNNNYTLTRTGYTNTSADYELTCPSTNTYITATLKCRAYDSTYEKTITYYFSTYTSLGNALVLKKNTVETTTVEYTYQTNELSYYKISSTLLTNSNLKNYISFVNTTNVNNLTVNNYGNLTGIWNQAGSDDVIITLNSSPYWTKYQKQIRIDTLKSDNNYISFSVNGSNQVIPIDNTPVGYTLYYGNLGGPDSVLFKDITSQSGSTNIFIPTISNNYLTSSVTNGTSGKKNLKLDILKPYSSSILITLTAVENTYYNSDTRNINILLLKGNVTYIKLNYPTWQGLENGSNSYYGAIGNTIYFIDHNGISINTLPYGKLYGQNNNRLNFLTYTVSNQGSQIFDNTGGEDNVQSEICYSGLNASYYEEFKIINSPANSFRYNKYKISFDLDTTYYSGITSYDCYLNLIDDIYDKITFKKTDGSTYSDEITITYKEGTTHGIDNTYSVYTGIFGTGTDSHGKIIGLSPAYFNINIDSNITWRETDIKPTIINNSGEISMDNAYFNNESSSGSYLNVYANPYDIYPSFTVNHLKIKTLRSPVELVVYKNTTGNYYNAKFCTSYSSKSEDLADNVMFSVALKGNTTRSDGLLTKWGGRLNTGTNSSNLQGSSNISFTAAESKTGRDAKNGRYRVINNTTKHTTYVLFDNFLSISGSSYERVSYIITGLNTSYYNTSSISSTYIDVKTLPYDSYTFVIKDNDEILDNENIHTMLYPKVNYELTNGNSGLMFYFNPSSFTYYNINGSAINSSFTKYSKSLFLLSYLTDNPSSYFNFRLSSYDGLKNPLDNFNAYTVNKKMIEEIGENIGNTYIRIPISFSWEDISPLSSKIYHYNSYAISADNKISSMYSEFGFEIEKADSILSFGYLNNGITGDDATGKIFSYTENDVIDAFSFENSQYINQLSNVKIGYNGFPLYIKNYAVTTGSIYYRDDFTNTDIYYQNNLDFISYFICYYGSSIANEKLLGGLKYSASYSNSNLSTLGINEFYSRKYHFNNWDNNKYLLNFSFRFNFSDNNGRYIIYDSAYNSYYKQGQLIIDYRYKKAQNPNLGLSNNTSYLTTTYSLEGNLYENSGVTIKNTTVNPPYIQIVKELDPTSLYNQYVKDRFYQVSGSPDIENNTYTNLPQNYFTTGIQLLTWPFVTNEKFYLLSMENDDYIKTSMPFWISTNKGTPSISITNDIGDFTYTYLESDFFGHTYYLGKYYNTHPLTRLFTINTSSPFPLTVYTSSSNYIDSDTINIPSSVNPVNFSAYWKSAGSTNVTIYTSGNAYYNPYRLIKNVNTLKATINNFELKNNVFTLTYNFDHYNNVSYGNANKDVSYLPILFPEISKETFGIASHISNLDIIQNNIGIYVDKNSIIDDGWLKVKYNSYLGSGETLSSPNVTIKIGENAYFNEINLPIKIGSERGENKLTYNGHIGILYDSNNLGVVTSYTVTGYSNTGTMTGISSNTAVSQLTGFTEDEYSFNWLSSNNPSTTYFTITKPQNQYYNASTAKIWAETWKSPGWVNSSNPVSINSSITFDAQFHNAVNPGSGHSGTVMYFASTNPYDTNANSKANYSSTIPSVRNANEYYIWYYIVETTTTNEYNQGTLVSSSNPTGGYGFKLSSPFVINKNILYISSRIDGSNINYLATKNVGWSLNTPPGISDTDEKSGYWELIPNNTNFTISNINETFISNGNPNIRFTIKAVGTKNSTITIDGIFHSTNSNYEDWQASLYVTGSKVITATIIPINVPYICDIKKYTWDGTNKSLQIKVNNASTWNGNIISWGYDTNYGNNLNNCVYNTNYNIGSEIITPYDGTTIYFKITGGDYYNDTVGSQKIYINKLDVNGEISGLSCSVKVEETKQIFTNIVVTSQGTITATSSNTRDFTVNIERMSSDTSSQDYNKWKLSITGIRTTSTGTITLSSAATGNHVASNNIIINVTVFDIIGTLKQTVYNSFNENIAYTTTSYLYPDDIFRIYCYTNWDAENYTEQSIPYCYYNNQSIPMTYDSSTGNWGDSTGYLRYYANIPADRIISDSSYYQANIITINRALDRYRTESNLTINYNTITYSKIYSGNSLVHLVNLGETRVQQIYEGNNKKFYNPSP